MRDLNDRLARCILGVGPFAGPDEVQRAARRLCKRHHPDLGGRALDLQRVLWARARLLDGAPPRRLAA